MTTKYIEEFLTKFSDQRLANLQRAAEDGDLQFRNSCGCLLHHYEGEYLQTKHGALRPLAHAAELEFGRIGHVNPYGSEPDYVEDARRCEVILPLIHAEWARRARPVPVTFEQPAKLEVLVRG